MARLADAACTKAKAPPWGKRGFLWRSGRGGVGTAGFLTLSIGDEEGSIDNCGASVADQSASEMEAGSLER